jgi:PAP2 superfamily
MSSLQRLTGLTVIGLLVWTAPVYADAVTYWNAIAQPAIAAGNPGAPGTLDSALVQIAVHDAVQALDKRYEPYYLVIRGAKGSQSAAVAAAAHDVLVGLYPAQAVTLDPMYFNYLADNGLTNDPGLDAGHQAATALLTVARKPPAVVPPFVGSNDIGRWRPTDSFIGAPPAPKPFSPMLAPWIADATPFSFANPSRFRPGPPPALTSEKYTKDYNEVKSLGAAASTGLTTLTRTAEQTDIAYFYGENAISQWNRALRGIAGAHITELGDSARLFALANMAMADAIITAWDAKRYYFFWRPLTAIQLGDSDGNAQTAGDPDWRPLVNNPNYPDYISGANSVAGSMTRTLQLFFHTDDMTFDVTSVQPLAIIKTRTYNHFSDAAQDVVNARIYLGIHFRTADEVARTQSRSVAKWVYRHELLPLDH